MALPAHEVGKLARALRQLAGVAREHDGVGDAPRGRAVGLAVVDQQRYELVARNALQAFVWTRVQTSAALGNAAAQRWKALIVKGPKEHRAAGYAVGDADAWRRRCDARPCHSPTSSRQTLFFGNFSGHADGERQGVDRIGG